MDKFIHDFNSIAQCGILDNGGVTRLALTPADHEARTYLIEIMRAEGLRVHIDAAGNIHGVLEGTEPHLPEVVIGSHLDSVPQGGHYDGVVGVLAGIEVVRRLAAKGLHAQRSIRIINFCAEESSRFGVATIGSKAITRKIDVEVCKNLTDRNGVSFAAALNQCGCDIDALEHDILHPEDIYALFELHIEQGRRLEQEGIDIGLVSAIAAPSRFDVYVEGRSDHSGNTPMHMRHDALAGAAELVLAVEQIATRASNSCVGTVGVLDVEPGAMNVVPGRVHMQIDIRDIDMDGKKRASNALEKSIAEMSSRRGLEVKSTTLCDDRPVPLDINLRTRVATLAQELDISSIEMPSGAGHDAMNFADIAPTALLFIPSIDGVSHNIREQSAFEAIEKGIELLYATVAELVQTES
ncbi:MAG: M20 family metallo-hydrolase [Desulfuromonadaceae bacterium]|nr:M20 family metallo-hydrolase [Geobacteraceae bacterium]